ncbi:hypothetical protein AKJ16_DCAP15063, partial [Drosera capensis]
SLDHIDMAEPDRMELMLNSSSNAESNDFGEDDWVVVKKQRVCIHIPPLPLAKHPTVKSSEHNQLEKGLCALLLDGTSRQPALEKLSGGLVGKKRKPLYRPIREACTHQEVISTGLAPAFLLTPMQPGIGKVCPSKFRSYVHPPELPPRILDMKLRVANLERKLIRAGGLNQWLASLGLEQFIKIFKGKVVSRLQVANLSMKKLKDMGALAVGPRRKLMHALDCLCQPYCFEAI